MAFLGFGSMVHPALGAAQALDASVADMRFVKPRSTSSWSSAWPRSTTIW
ncbi:hypothetical protein ACTMU2_32650 [Cupriavidus basilensis]